VIDDAAPSPRAGELSPARRARLTALLARLCDVERDVRILSHVAWPEHVRDDFLSGGGRSLPRVEYPAFDPAPVHAGVAEVRAEALKVFGNEHAVGAWLQRLCDDIDGGASLLGSVGTPAYLEHGTALFGAPARTLPDGRTTTLALARSFDAILDGLDHLPLAFPREDLDAEALAERLGQAVTRRFGEAAPRIELVDALAAKAMAGSRRIRIRRDARFSHKDLAQLLHHEAMIHVATKLNGQAQTALPILARSHAGTTRTQEGLAVFAEFISGSMDLERLRRLADRVIATQMAINGADFLEVYRYFLERTGGREGAAYDNARRVFRGGVLEGGAPLTKDVVYLEGLLRVHNLLRTLVSLGRADLMHALFCGKLDIEDLAVLAQLAEAGMCQPPRFLPPWLEDAAFLVSYLAYSSFLNRVDLQGLRDHYQALVAAAPVCRWQAGAAAGV
jgi:uncharacterized protein (TIGR02421 family)